MRSLAGQFGPALQAHLTLSLQDLQWRADQALAGGLGGGESLPSHEAPEAPRDLLLVLLRSQEEPCPWRHLLGEAVGLRCPTLGVLAACHQVRRAAVSGEHTRGTVRSTLLSDL